MPLHLTYTVKGRIRLHAENVRLSVTGLNSVLDGMDRDCFGRLHLQLKWWIL